MCMHFHGQSTVCLALSYRICITKKTGILIGVPLQTHARKHQFHRLTIPKQCLRLSPSQKHELLTQEIFRCSHRIPVDQGGERHSNGVCKQVIRGKIVLAIC